VSKKTAKARAYATVNKEEGGGKKSGSGRGRKTSHASSRRGGRKAAKKRSHAASVRAGKKAARTRKRS
jgi:hypothetical protein